MPHVYHLLQFILFGTLGCRVYIDVTCTAVAWRHRANKIRHKPTLRQPPERTARTTPTQQSLPRASAPMSVEQRVEPCLPHRRHYSSPCLPNRRWHSLVHGSERREGWVEGGEGRKGKGEILGGSYASEYAH